MPEKPLYCKCAWCPLLTPVDTVGRATAPGWASADFLFRPKAELDAPEPDPVPYAERDVRRYFACPAHRRWLVAAARAASDRAAVGR